MQAINFILDCCRLKESLKTDTSMALLPASVYCSNLQIIFKSLPHNFLCLCGNMLIVI